MFHMTEELLGSCKLSRVSLRRSTGVFSDSRIIAELGGHYADLELSKMGGSDKVSGRY